MNTLTPEAKKLFAEQLGLIATASKEGIPNLAPKGTLQIIDDSTMAYAEIAGQTTYKNILNNPMVTVAAIDRANREMVRCLGKAEVLTSGELYENLASRLEKQGRPRPKFAIKISIEEVRYMKL